MQANIPAEITIRAMSSAREAHLCAEMMSQSEPWITFRRDYTISLKILNDPIKEVNIAFLDSSEDPAGFTVLTMTGAFVGYVQTLCVAPDLRGQGIGSALLQYAERRILGDAPNVFICVSSFNPNAQRLYERLGYSVVGELKDYVVEGHSEILLRKTIGPLSRFVPQEVRKRS